MYFLESMKKIHMKTVTNVKNIKNILLIFYLIHITTL